MVTSVTHVRNMTAQKWDFVAIQTFGIGTLIDPIKLMIDDPDTDVVIIDAELPKALAVLNPKRHDCPYPDKNLAGVGVALKLVQALCERMGHPEWVPGFVKVAAIGTLADVVPLVGENRVIAKLGLGMLAKGPHKVGLRALLDVCGLTGREIDSYHIGFVLAPRVNAAGRMATPDIAARLLLASDESMADEARALAQQLAEQPHRGLHALEVVAGLGVAYLRQPGQGADADILNQDVFGHPSGNLGFQHIDSRGLGQ